MKTTTRREKIYCRRMHSAHRPTQRRLLLETLENRVLMAGLVAHWAADNSAVDSIGGNNGTLYNGATYAAGQIGQAFSFDGQDDRIHVADSASFKLTQSLTIEAWVKANGVSWTQGLIFFRGDDRGGLDPYQLSLQPSGALNFSVHNGTRGASANTMMPIGQFVHVAATLDDASNEMKIYINGVLRTQTNTDVRPFAELDAASNPGIGIGNHGGYPFGHYFPFNGLIDDLKLYDRALTSTEVLADFNAGKGTLQPSISVSDSVIIEGQSNVQFLGAFVASNSGGLSAPKNVIMGPDGNGDSVSDLYVASSGTDEILRFDGVSGSFIDVFVTRGNHGLDNPWAIAFGPNGNLFVSGTLTGNVLQFDGSTGNFVNEFVPSGVYGLKEAKGLAFGTDGNLYVSNSAGASGVAGPHEVLRFQGPLGASPGAPMPSPGKSSAIFVSDGSGGLNNPTGLSFGPDGNLYVTNTWNDSVNKYDGTTGQSLGTFVATGSGGLDVPSAISFRADGTMYVTSQGSIVLIDTVITTNLTGNSTCASAHCSGVSGARASGGTLPSRIIPTLIIATDYPPGRRPRRAFLVW